MAFLQVEASAILVREESFNFSTAFTNPTLDRSPQPDPPYLAEIVAIDIPWTLTADYR